MKFYPHKFALAGTTAYVVYLVLLFVVPTFVPINGLSFTKIDRSNLFSLLVMIGLNYIFYYVLAQSYNRYSSNKKTKKRA